MVLRGDEHEARACRGRLGLWRASESCKDAEYGYVGGENAKTNGSDDGEAENDGHQDRNHGSTNLSDAACIRCTAQKSVYLLLSYPAARTFNLNPIPLR